MEPPQPSLESLSPLERQVLAVLVAVGEAALSPEALAALTEVDDVRPTLVELERRGLIRREDDRRALAPGLAPRLRRAWNIIDTADRVLRQLISIAEDGKLTLDDLDAVLGLTEWAAQTGRWSELLRLVKATETALSLKERVETWIELVEHANAAARATGDRESEAWAKDQLDACARAMAKMGPAAGGAEPRTVAADGRRRALRSLWTGAGALAIGAAGFGAGFALADESQPASGTTATLPPNTVTLPRRTVTLAGDRVTLPGRTVTVPGGTVTLPPVTTTTVSTELTTTTVFTPPPTVPQPG